jgi:hypothetical protein
MQLRPWLATCTLHRCAKESVYSSVGEGLVFYTNGELAFMGDNRGLRSRYQNNVSMVIGPVEV